MPRYYEADEHVFQKLRAAGKTSWDEQANPNASFDDFILRAFLEESLALLEKPLVELTALEIGCGTGPASCFLAAKGLTVRGIDVSPTALDMARQNAAERGLSIRFDNADICRMPEQTERYDLIIDGHCLHYLIDDAHRRCAFAAIHRLLKPAGQVLIETMIAHPDLVVGQNYRIDARGVLSIKIDNPADREGAFMEAATGNLEGMWFAPYRRLLTAEAVVTELRDAGFVIHSQRASAQKDARKPMLMQVRAGRES